MSCSLPAIAGSSASIRAAEDSTVVLVTASGARTGIRPSLLSEPLRYGRVGWATPPKARFHGRTPGNPTFARPANSAKSLTLPDSIRVPRRLLRLQLGSLQQSAATASPTGAPQRSHRLASRRQ